MPPRKRNRVDVNLSDHDMKFCQEEMKRLGLSHITDLLREIINDRRRFGAVPETSAISKDLRVALQGIETRIDEVTALLIGRISKLERVQRTIVLNTAHARGFAVGFLRTAPPESKKTIEQDVLKNFNEQKEFFFNLFPEQREGETKEARA